MGFLNQNGGGDGKPRVNDLYLEITGDAKKIRPLMSEPKSIWVHRIFSVETTNADGQKVFLRRFSTEVCTSNSRNGVGCQACTTQDPLWDKLDTKSKYNSKGQITHFPKQCLFLGPVFDHTLGDVRVLRGGNGTFGEMDKWYEAQPEGMKDLGRCDWNVWKTGAGIKTEYNMVRFDASDFKLDPELKEKCKTVMERAFSDLTPTPHEVFLNKIKGESEFESPTQESKPVTSGFMARAQEPTPVETKPQPPPPAQTTTTPPTLKAAPDTNDTLTSFVKWINEQKEFQAMGMINTFIPMLKELNGGVASYHQLPPEKLEALQQALSAKLEAVRSNK